MKRATYSKHPGGMSAIRAANEAAGDHWFENSTMRFFESHVHGEPRVIGGRVFFVSSEAQRPFVGVFGTRFAGQPGRYSVREALPNGSIATVGKFHSHLSARDAWNWLDAHLHGA